MSLITLFKLTKPKLLFSIIVSIALVILTYSLNSLGFRQFLLSLGIMQQLFIVLTNLVLLTIFYYPFSCGIIFVFNMLNHKNKKEKEKVKKLDLIIALACILILNPPGISSIYSGIMYLNNNVIHKPCGLEIIGFNDDSPAKDSGMSVGEIITMADNRQIDTLDSLFIVFADKKPRDSVSITTNANTYNIILEENPDTHMPVTGIKIKEKYC